MNRAITRDIFQNSSPANDESVKDNLTGDKIVHVGFDWTYQATIYVVIGVIGIFGNGFTIVILSSSSKLRTKLINLLLINQSAIDFLASIFLVASANLPYGTTGHFGTSGQLFCKIWNPRLPLWSLLHSSTANLVMINIERYMGVVHPIFHKTKIRISHSVMAMVACWISGPIFNIPPVVLTSEALPSGVCATLRFWPSAAVSQFYGILAAILQFFIPIGVMAFVYARMIFVLKNKAKIQPAVVQSTDGLNQGAKIRRNILKTLASVSVCFIICWTWNQVFFLVANLGVEVTYGSFYDFTVYMAFLNSCLNPIIYAKQYKDFQMQSKKLVGAICGYRNNDHSDGSVSSTS